MNSTYIYSSRFERDHLSEIPRRFRQFANQLFKQLFVQNGFNSAARSRRGSDEHAKLPLTDNVQLEEVLQVRVRQGRVLSVAFQDSTVIIRDGREDQRAEDHRGIAALHHLLAYAKIGEYRIIRTEVSTRSRCDPTSRPEVLIIDLAVPECLVSLDPGDTGTGVRACRLARDGVVLLRLHDRQLRQNLHGERLHWNRPNGSSLPRVIALRGNSRTCSFLSRGSTDRESRGYS